MSDLVTLINASQFEGLAVTKTPAGTFAVSVMTALGHWSPEIERPIPSEAIAAVLCPAPIAPPLPY